MKTHGGGADESWHFTSTTGSSWPWSSWSRKALQRHMSSSGRGLSQGDGFVWTCRRYRPCSGDDAACALSQSPATRACQLANPTPRVVTGHAHTINSKSSVLDRVSMTTTFWPRSSSISFNCKPRPGQLQSAHGSSTTQVKATPFQPGSASAFLRQGAPLESHHHHPSTTHHLMQNHTDP